MHLNAGLGILDWGNSVKQDSKNHAAFVLISLLAKYSMLVWHCTVQIIFVKTPYSLFHMILLKKINSIKSFCANLFPFACVLFGNRFISWKIMRTITRFQTCLSNTYLKLCQHKKGQTFDGMLVFLILFWIWINCLLQ